MIFLARKSRFNDHAVMTFFNFGHLAFCSYQTALSWIIRILKTSDLVYSPIGIGLNWNEKF